MNGSENNRDRVWRLLAVTCVTLTTLYVSIVQVSGVDFWLQAKIGEIIVRDGAIPDTLLFPFTEAATQKFNAHEWMASVLFHQMLSLLGDANMPFVIGFAGLAFVCLSARLAYLRGGLNTPAALIFGMVALATENYRHVLRPELLSLLLISYFWILLEQLRAQSRWKPAVISTIVVVLWANSHGSFILAPLMTAMYAVGLCADRWVHKRAHREEPKGSVVLFASLSVVQLMACLLNPFGIELLEFVFGFSNNAELSTMIAEWTPTLDRQWLGLRAFWIAGLVWIGTLLVLLKNWRQLSAVDALFFVFFTLLAAKAIRFPVYLGLMSAAVCSPYVALKWSKREYQTRLYQLAVGIAVAVGAAAIAYGNAQGLHPYSTGYAKLSDRMVRTLGNSIHHGNVLTSMELGAELIYIAYPRLRPSIDCRVDSYGLEYLALQDQLLNSDALLQEYVRRYDVRYMLVLRSDLNGPVERKTWRDDQWVLVDMDKTAVFLKRVDVRD